MTSASAVAMRRNAVFSATFLSTLSTMSAAALALITATAVNASTTAPTIAPSQFGTSGIAIQSPPRMSVKMSPV